jgi:hypothetical protein
VAANSSGVLAAGEGDVTGPLCVMTSVFGLLHATANSEMATINSAKVKAFMLFPRSK